GVGEIKRRFRHFDTICSATQDRQDAVMSLIREGMTLMLVVGGFNSSNTGHLAEIAAEFCPTFHIDDVACILSTSRIRSKKPHSSEIIETENWLPAGPVKLGITAGASTPDRMVEEVINRIFEIAS
ncbi:MAG: 4-hydroxy-3-methylbut-2-enyl diphosphate reductase, partial [Candidatus Omnitrophota bacterium]